MRSFERRHARDAEKGNGEDARHHAQRLWPVLPQASHQQEDQHTDSGLHQPRHDAEWTPLSLECQVLPVEEHAREGTVVRGGVLDPDTRPPSEDIRRGGCPGPLQDVYNVGVGLVEPTHILAEYRIARTREGDGYGHRDRPVERPIRKKADQLARAHRVTGFAPAPLGPCFDARVPELLRLNEAVTSKAHTRKTSTGGENGMAFRRRGGTAQHAGRTTVPAPHSVPVCGNSGCSGEDHCVAAAL